MKKFRKQCITRIEKYQELHFLKISKNQKLPPKPKIQ